MTGKYTTNYYLFRTCASTRRSLGLNLVTFYDRVSSPRRDSPPSEASAKNSKESSGQLLDGESAIDPAHLSSPIRIKFSEII